ncbi:hypothetical protein FDE94_09040 [Clostridium botulinum]|nr:hypothetical protein [Clostridium botulinum]NHI48011.1 hypothetical protein [Clostridium botulinum]
MYSSRPQVDVGYVDLINAIILRAVQDARMQSLTLNSSKVNKDLVKEKAESFIMSEEFAYMCECVGKNWAEIRRLTFMN